MLSMDRTVELIVVGVCVAPGWRFKQGSWLKNRPRGRQAAWEQGATVPAPEEWPDPSSPPTRYLTGETGGFCLLLWCLWAPSDPWFFFFFLSPSWNFPFSYCITNVFWHLFSLLFAMLFLSSFYTLHGRVFLVAKFGFGCDVIEITGFKLIPWIGVISCCCFLCSPLAQRCTSPSL